MFQPIGDDNVSTIPDDVYETHVTQLNNMRQHWDHSSDHILAQGSASQEELEKSANSWDVRPVANI